MEEVFVLALGFGLVGVVACFFAEALGALEQEFGAVGLAEEVEACDLDDAVGDGGCIEDPAPGCVFGDEAADDGAYGWA